MSSSSFFKSSGHPLEYFDFNFADQLFVENRVLDWIGSERSDGTRYQSLRDFFQPHYLPTQMRAFLWGLDTIPDELNFAWLSHLHSLGISALKDERGEAIPHVVRRESIELLFPPEFYQVFFGSSAKASSQGIESLAREISDPTDQETRGKVAFVMLRMNNLARSGVNMVETDVATAVQYYAAQKKLFGEKQFMIQELLTGIDFKPIETFIDKALGVVTEDKAKARLNREGYGALTNMVGYKLLNRNPIEIRRKAEKLIDDYNRSQKTTDDEKITAIIKLAKGLLNLHVWTDGNGRLCAHLLLNILLIKNGLYPAFLRQNCLDAFTLDELRTRVKDGMRDFRIKRSDKPTLEKFREENGYAVAELSELSKAILKNDIGTAKNLLQTNNIKLSDVDLALLASCSSSEINWFNKEAALEVNGKPCTWPQLRKKLLKLAVDNANENLWYSIIKNDIERGDKSYLNDMPDIVRYGSLRLFELIKPVFTIEEQIVLIPSCRDVNLASSIFDAYASQYKDAGLTDKMSELIEEVFSSSTPYSILLKFTELRAFKQFASEAKNRADLIGLLEAKSYLSAEEKDTLFKKIDERLSYKPRNLLEDFPAAGLSLKKK